MENPKLAGSGVYDCKPQKGPCPMGCNQCFYNRPGAFYFPIEEDKFPNFFEIGEKGIVRVNSGHDSNLQREYVIESTKKYPRKFYNTSIPRFDFPDPVVFTANRYEEEPAYLPQNFVWACLENIMAIRLRVSSTNLSLIDPAVKEWTKVGIPVVLTFMAYYSQEPAAKEKYDWKVRHINSYWCPKESFMVDVLKREKEIGGDLVYACGLETGYCKNCHNCSNLYYKKMSDRQAR
jgi:hypothetical protein